MNISTIPTLELPTSDYDQMRSMNNRRLIHVLRSAVLSPDREERFTPRPPQEHDGYTVLRDIDSIRVHLLREGEVIFHCVFQPFGEEY